MIKGFKPIIQSSTTVPAIVSKVMTLLQNEGHSCAMFDMSKRQLSWCNSDECEQEKIYTNMRNRQEEQEVFLEKLKGEGHKCTYIMESYPMQVGWCGKTPCTGRKF